MDPAELLSALESISWPLLFLVIVPLAISYIFRILRWRILLSPMERVSTGDSAGPLLTGFMVNSILPGRVGEVLRALLLSRRTGISRASSFATVVLARIFDGLTLATMTMIILVMLWGRLSAGIRIGLIGAALLYLLVLMILISLRKKRERAAFILTAPLRWLGMNSLSGKVEGVLISFSHGLEILKDWRETAKVIACSLLIWGTLVISVLPVFWAMHLEMDWYYPILVLILAGLGMLIPTPAGTGTIHGALVLVLPGIIGISTQSTRVLALLFHTTQFLPIIAAGLAAAVREGVTANQVSELAREEPPEI